MSEQKKQTVIIDEKEYIIDDMAQEAQMLLNHVADLDRKILNSKFNLDQLQVGRDAFFAMLKQTLESKTETIDK